MILQSDVDDQAVEKSKKLLGGKPRKSSKHVNGRQKPKNWRLKNKKKKKIATKSRKRNRR